MTVRRARTGIALLLALAAGAASAQLRAEGRRELAAQLDAVDLRLRGAEDNALIVEKQYTQRPTTSVEAKLRRFSKGEIQYLLGDYPTASVLFYDLVSDREFQQHAKYGDALFYLAESLYQQQNVIGARLYLRELLKLEAQNFKDALTRYLEIASQLNEYSGVEEYIARARVLLGGKLPPELSYAYGKWLFKRTDLPDDVRLSRARAAFEPVAAEPGPAQLPAAYFLGVAFLQEKKLEPSAAQFQKVADAEPKSDREKQVKELANLALARVLFESGKVDEAKARYGRIPTRSPLVADALYELAWAHVKTGHFAEAKNATEILLIAAPDSLLAPEARMLQAHLFLKLKRYDDASETYDAVINTYAPVRDEVDALLAVHKDPVAYFDDMLSRGDRKLDVAQLLPPVALKWGLAQREVADAVRMVDDIEKGRRGVAEGSDITSRIRKALDERGLETFPELQDGYTRAEAIASSLTQANEELLRVETALLREHLTQPEHNELSAARAKRSALEKRFAELPKTPEEVATRKLRLQERIDRSDRDAFKLGYELQSMAANLTALEKWVKDTRGAGKAGPEEAAFRERIEAELASIRALQEQLATVRKDLADQRGSAASAVEGEEAIRAQYDEALAKEHRILAAAEPRLDAQGQELLARAHGARARIGAVAGRVDASKGWIRDQVATRGAQIRDKISAEERLLAAYQQEVGTVSSSARGLVGRIAFDSFRRVRQQFYDLVLKADVGIVDVAFTRKQDKTGEIQKLSQARERELETVDRAFKRLQEDGE